MVILPVNKCYAGIRMSETVAEGKAAESRPEHNHMGQLALHEFSFVRDG
jgi:hypothetical protein